MRQVTDDSSLQAVEKQRLRYDSEMQDHRSHYEDQWTQRYRDLFYRAHFSEFDLEGKQVLDAMCAWGIETEYLLSRGAVVTGLDISAENAEAYVERFARPCFTESVHEMSFSDQRFDVVYIMGGLHHVLPLLEQALSEVHRVLKPGGYFFFIEPNKETWINRFRSAWYKRSSRFADEEDAISYHETLEPLMSDRFASVKYATGGSVAYLLIGQSLITRVPNWLKARLAPALFWLEHRLDGWSLAPQLYMAGVWQKLP